MTTYVLVHGAWADQTVWNVVTPLLAEQGHKVLTLDLPGHGGDTTAPETLRLEHYRDAVIGLIGTAQNVVLVGHSMAGMIISAVAEAVPDQLQALIFVCAYLPRTGESLLQLSREDQASHVGRYWRQADPEHYSPAWIAAEGVVEVFGADCAPVYQTLLLEHHRPEPLGPFADSVTLTAERYGNVPRWYIETLKDQAVSHQLQTLMLQRVAVQGRFALPTSHSPFFAAPQELVAHLTNPAIIAQTTHDQ